MVLCILQATACQALAVLHGRYGMRAALHPKTINSKTVLHGRYGMREALAIVAEQGLDSMWKRHTEMGKYLWAGLNEIGLEPYVQDPEDRLITVNTIRVPKDIEAVKLIKFAMDKFSLEISAGEAHAHFSASFCIDAAAAGGALGTCLKSPENCPKGPGRWAIAGTALGTCLNSPGHGTVLGADTSLCGVWLRP